MNRWTIVIENIQATDTEAQEVAAIIRQRLTELGQPARTRTITQAAYDQATRPPERMRNAKRPGHAA